jgi:hypothetical protein
MPNPTLQPANVVAWDRLQTGDAWLDPASSNYRWRLLAEGDSWFTLGGLPTSNLLFSLRFAGPAIIANCAMPGDTIRHMAEIAANRELEAALDRRFGCPWDALLLSGGGNDLIDRVRDIVLPAAARPAGATPDACCDEQAILSLQDDIAAGYRRIVALRDAPESPCPGVPAIVHTYDWVTPRPSPSLFIGVPAKGPWLAPALADAGVPPAEWNALSDYLLGRVADTILALARPGPLRLPAFHVADTRDTLRRAQAGTTGPSNDWQNEIHPTSDGYRKLAGVIGREARRRLRA